MIRMRETSAWRDQRCDRCVKPAEFEGVKILLCHDHLVERVLDYLEPYQGRVQREKVG